MPQSRPRTRSSPNGRVVIAGPGRSGTTFLVALLTELGFDTGFDRDDLETIDARNRAGLETGLYRHLHERSPISPAYILKSPMNSTVLDWACQRGDLCIEHLYVPIRDATQIARSRARVSGLGVAAGGFWEARNEDEQRAQVQRMFYELMLTVAARELPCTVLEFPRLAQDCAYLHRRLEYLCADIDRTVFDAAFARIARADWIHDYGAQA